MHNKEELIKQQEIGQQFMIIRMVHDENDTVSRGGVPFLRRSDITRWAQKSEEEMEYFLNDIAALDEFNICVDAAKEYAEGLSADVYGFFLSTFRKYGYLYISNMLGMRKSYDSYSDGMEGLARINARRIIDSGIKVDEEIQSAARFEDSLMFYFKFYIGRIVDVASEGYDWAVVSEMLRADKEFTELIKLLVDNKLSIAENSMLEKQLYDIIQEGKTGNKKLNCKNCRYYELSGQAPYCTKGGRKKKLEFGIEKGCKRGHEVFKRKYR